MNKKNIFRGRKSMFYFNNNKTKLIIKTRVLFKSYNSAFGWKLNIILIIKNYKFSEIFNSFSISLVNDWNDRKHNILWHVFNDKLIKYLKIDINFKNKGIIFQF
jgi:hypothetical protein